MNNIIERTWKQGCMVGIEDLRGLTFQNEALAHTFKISGVDADGSAIALTGTPAGVMLRADNMDVALTCALSDGCVTASLPAECYDVPGRAEITIYLTEDGHKVCIYAAIVSVNRTSSGTASPGTAADVVDLVNLMQTSVDAAEDSATDAAGSATSAAASAATASAAYNVNLLAPNFVQETPYPAGQHVIYDGGYYVLPNGHEADVTWANTSKTQLTVGGELTDLKSAIDDSETREYGKLTLTTESGKYTTYAASGGPFYQYNSNAGLQYVKFPVRYNEKYKVTGNLTQAGAVRSFFTISDNAYLSVITISGQTLEFVVPYGAKEAIICGYTGTPITVERIKQAALQGKNVAVFGDSLMAGLELNFSAVDDSLSVSRGIWGRVADYYGCNIVANQSLGGATIESIYNGDDEDGRDSTAISRRMYKYDNENTDLILFTGGYNDAQKQYLGQTVYNIGELTALKNMSVYDWGSCISCLESAFTHLRYKNPYCKIIWIRSWYGGGADVASLVKDYYDAIEACCNKWGVAVCDISKNGNLNLLNADDSAKFGRRNYTSYSDSTTDTIHISNVGFDFIMPVVYNTIDKVMKY